MNFSSLETTLLQQLKRLLERGLHFFQGPYTLPVFGGLRTEIHVHAASYLDFDGVTHDGAVIARYGINDSILKGYTEERPGRITIAVTCVAGSYAAMKTCCGLVAPTVLSSLGSLSTISLGASPDGTSEATFSDCKSWLHECSTTRDHDGKAGYFCGRMVFYIDGFLRVKVRWKKIRKTNNKKALRSSDSKRRR